MRLGSLLLVGSSIMAVLAAFACQQQPVQTLSRDRGGQEETEEQTGGEDEEEEEAEEQETKSKTPKPGKTDDTCLGKANLAFDDVECNKCMSDDAACCQATITCFKDDPECGALHGCMLKCGGGGGVADGPTTFATEVFPAVNPACGSCHLAGTGGAAIFFGASADATYPLFKARNYHLPNSLFVTKGLHNGPALTPAQRAAVDKWVAAEAAPPPPADAGAEPDGGAAACKEACKAQYPNALTKWQTYNTCATSTCKAECL